MGTKESQAVEGKQSQSGTTVGTLGHCVSGASKCLPKGQKREPSGSVHVAWGVSARKSQGLHSSKLWVTQTC